MRRVGTHRCALVFLEKINMQYQNYTGKTIFKAYFENDTDTLQTIERIPSVGHLQVVRPTQTAGLEFTMLDTSLNIDLPKVAGVKYIVNRNVFESALRPDFVTNAGLNGFTKIYTKSEIRGLVDGGVFTAAADLDLSLVEGAIKKLVVFIAPYAYDYEILAFSKLESH